MDVREKLVELLNEMQDSGIVETPAGFGFTKQYIENERIANHLIAHGVTVQEWFPVSEPPKEKINCIVHYKHAYCDNDGYWALGIVFYDGDKFHLDPAYKVTHWMPLPPAPKGE